MDIKVNQVVGLLNIEILSSHKNFWKFHYKFSSNKWKTQNLYKEMEIIIF